MNICKPVTPLIVILLVTVLFVGVITVHSTIPAAAQPMGMIQGVNYGGFWNNVYQSSTAGSALDALKTTGANYGLIIVTLYQNTPTDNSMFVDANQTPTYVLDRTSDSRPPLSRDECRDKDDDNGRERRYTGGH